MHVRLRLALCLALLGSLAIIPFSSCGYTGCADVPVLTSISPASAPVDAPAFTLTLTGRHFHSDTILFFGGAEHVSTTVNETTMTATIEPTDIPTPGTLEVWVTGIPGGSNLNGPCGGGLSAKLPFTVE
jgi:hypothetical protein